jgi:hypothetical protein
MYVVYPTVVSIAALGLPARFPPSLDRDRAGIVGGAVASVILVAQFVATRLWAWRPTH